ncbi:MULTISPECIES: ArsR/SmtB family transcription factor [Pseudomonas]|uniref:ArsR family transcriptional regulator n=1 Tax=Pseudomonas tritici TaxID=2745518 RepID=A0A8H9YQQ4_9PSED|nr:MULTISPECIES: helix-turn-helix transcriptional regulator [Pseudomonas]MBP2873544.1 helix-turn-helix transcriptional regulator [Pseudomonas sp. SWRI144]MBW8127285.1 ArsR family transcriptional regulator [Pseudomonas sp. LAP_36]MBW8134694.1 ArsR family transcriptional regulator [Pseudomonas sp. PAMC 26818]QXH81909.1 ArsR family transcriptional regulator [Pseudomonas tritici]CRM32836.1 HTH-type transcriptional regulator CmtR [Pseudomonas sp. 52 E 6]
MSNPSTFTEVAALIAEPARAAILLALFDGRALPAGELAFAASITPQTASTHLAKLVAGGLLACETQGRHRYYRLAGAHVAQAIEYLSAIAPMSAIVLKPQSREAQGLRFARCCYNHLAGQLGVAVTQALEKNGYLRAIDDKHFEVLPAGEIWLRTLGIDSPTVKPARQCLDWTERTHHVAGPLGVQLLSALCEAGWLRRSKNSRAVLVTPKGWAQFKAQLGLAPRDLENLEHKPALAG